MTNYDRLFPTGQWKGNSAGGAHKLILEERNSKKSNKKAKGGGGNGVKPPVKPDKRRGTYIQQDGDAKWFNNPQYRITVEKDTACYITMMQRDRRLVNTVNNDGGGGGGAVVEEGKEGNGAVGGTWFVVVDWCLRRGLWWW